MHKVVEFTTAQSHLVQGSFWKRMSGKILEHPFVAAQAELLVASACLSEWVNLTCTHCEMHGMPVWTASKLNGGQAPWIWSINLKRATYHSRCLRAVHLY